MAEEKQQSPGADEQRTDNILTEPSISMVYNKEKDQAKIISQNPDGTFGAVDPTPENEPMFFQMRQNIPENLLANFKKYYDNPTVNIYVFPRRILDHMKEAVKRYFNRTPSNAVKLLYNYKMRPDGSFESKMKTYGIRDNEMPWDTLARYGLSYGGMEKSGNLQRMRNYEPTSMLKLNYLDDVMKMSGDAKIRLKGKGDNVKVDMKFHTRTPEKQLFNIPFTEDDMKNLATYGNLGRIFPTPYGDKLVSRDFDTQQLDTVDAEKAFIGDYLYGKKLDQSDIDAFKRGESRLIQNMKGPKGPFDAVMQYNAIYRKVMEVLTPQQRNQLARDIAKKNDIERITSMPPEQMNEQVQIPQSQKQAPEPTPAPEPPTQGQTSKQEQRQPGAGQKPPRPQVAKPQPKPGKKAGKHI